jgi:hypothetical protein
MHVKFDEITNIGGEKDKSIVCDRVEGINAINESEAIIIEDVQDAPTTLDAPIINDEK